jgi:NAD(P)-dependent dehydrogenase (short-subunit alcohol dehydrogenase family)
MGLIDGKVAIVTGGGRGLGAAIARLFAAEGAAVVVSDLGGTPDGTGYHSDPAKQVADRIAAAGGRAVAASGDIAEVATGQRLVETAVSRFGALDIVINVAGIHDERITSDLPEGDWDAVIRAHLRGLYSTARPASAYWREQRNPEGHYRIINFTSISASALAPGQPYQVAATMGVIGLTSSLAHGLAGYGATANAISPGAPASPDRPADSIGTVALYLASERSDWLTGRVLHAHGHEVGRYQSPQTIRQQVSV